MPMAKSYAYEMDSSMMDEMSHVPDTIMSEPNVALWFFSGVCVALILVFLVRMYWKKK